MGVLTVTSVDLKPAVQAIKKRAEPYLWHENMNLHRKRGAVGLLLWSGAAPHKLEHYGNIERLEEVVFRVAMPTPVLA